MVSGDFTDLFSDKREKDPIIDELFEEEEFFIEKVTLPLFDMIYENEPNYWPMLVKMIDFMKSLDKKDLSEVKSRDQWKEMCDEQYVYSILPDIPAPENGGSASTDI